MRWYPMGDTAVSLHTLIPTMFWGDQLKSRVPSPDQIFMGGGGGAGGLWTNSNLKSQVLTKFSFLGREDSPDTTFLKYLSGALKEF